jgi:hypothetical protein
MGRKVQPSKDEILCVDWNTKFNMLLLVIMSLCLPAKITSVRQLKSQIISGVTLPQPIIIRCGM